MSEIIGASIIDTKIILQDHILDLEQRISNCKGRISQLEFEIDDRKKQIENQRNDIYTYQTVINKLKG